MRWPLRIRPLAGLLLLLVVGPCAAAPSAPNPGGVSPAPLPDYGGRDAPAVPTDTAGAATPNPVAQAGRALEALVIVLAGIVGVLYLLKRLGVAGNGSAAPLLGMRGAKHPDSALSIAGSPFALNIVQSHALPGAGGATLHLLSVNDETLLLIGATPHGVSLLAQWDQDGRKSGAEEARAEKIAFDDYLQRAGIAPEPGPARAAEERIALTADRLQDLLARSRAQAPEEIRR
ncbi:MAG: flagellar biosynthetic protein FliO [Armatimonadetes bacterium]|nr:flagellar biosynthetic protein FliO [Armatimonadota bacterium]